MILGKLNASEKKSVGNEMSNWHQKRRPGSEGRRYSDEMHNPFVSWTFRDLSKIDFESFKIFYIFDPRDQSPSWLKSHWEGERTDYITCLTQFSCF